MAWTVDILGLVAYYEGDFSSARPLYEQSLTRFRNTDEEIGIASALLGLGRIAMWEGEHSRARALLQESLAIFREVKEKHSSVWALNSLAWIGWHEGEVATARAHLVEALGLCRETGRYWESIDTLVSAGHLAQRQCSPARAARLFGAAEALRESIGEAMPPVERAGYEGSLTAVRAALGEERFAAAWAEGQALSREQAIQYALEERPE
jgi:tetratricopeptide (TPR) repeat protein